MKVFVREQRYALQTGDRREKKDGVFDRAKEVMSSAQALWALYLLVRNCFRSEAHFYAAH